MNVSISKVYGVEFGLWTENGIVLRESRITVCEQNFHPLHLAIGKKNH